MLFVSLLIYAFALKWLVKREIPRGRDAWGRGTVDAANQFSQVDGQSYTWDNNGNLLNDGQRTFTYDTADRLTGVTQGSLNTTFRYNGDGDRYAQTIGGVTTDYVLDPVGLAQVLVESANSQSTHYLPGLGQYSNAAWSYYLPDRLGSVRHLVNPAGTPLLSQSYDPFGNVLQQGGLGQSSFGYTGEQIDPTGLVYLRARYYDPAVGRFLTADSLIPDPLSSSGWNRYAYVGNNPLSFADPSGHEPCVSGNWGDCLPSNRYVVDYHLRNRFEELVWGKEAGGITWPEFRQAFLEAEALTACYDPLNIPNVKKLAAEMAARLGGSVDFEAYLTFFVLLDEDLMGYAYGESVEQRVSQTNGLMGGIFFPPGGGGGGSRPIAGGGASIENIPEGYRWRIQQFADKYDVEVTVVGSRAAGTANELSDWDYIISGNSKIRKYARQQLPRGIAGGEIGPRGETGIDVFNANNSPLNMDKPYITFSPGE